MRGNGLDGFILFVAVVFLVLAFYIYLRRDDTEYKKYAATADDVKINVSSLEAQTNKIIEAQQTFFANTVTALEQLNKRIDAVEMRKTPPQDLILRTPDKLNISVVYRPAIKKPLLEKVSPDIVSNKNGSLLHRAGLLSTENN